MLFITSLKEPYEEKTQQWIETMHTYKYDVCVLILFAN